MSKYLKLFKAYDVRGTYPEINEDVYYWSGLGLVKEILKPENLPLQVNIFRDCRNTSPDFYRAFCNGVKDGGGIPVTMGLGSTDFMYAACQLFNTPGAMITASHNPKDDNGLKVVKKAPQMLGLQSGLDKVRDFVISKIDIEPINKESWMEFVEDTEMKKSVWNFYKDKMELLGTIKHIDGLIAQNGKKMKIVVDAGNGMGGFLMEEVVKLYKNIDFVPLYWNLDGNYPNHPADPSNLANVQDLMIKVREEKADLGVAFDGDADRAYFVDEKGEFMKDNYLVCAIAKSILEEYYLNPDLDFNPAIVYSQPQSRCVPYTTLESNGVAVASKQGHTYMKADMSRYKAIYGGEGTGHHYFGKFGFMDSGTLVMVKLIQILVKTSVLPSEILKVYSSKYFLSGEINFKITDGMSFEDIKNKLLSHYINGSISTMDGVSIFYPDWKLNARASNTEPLLRLNVECIGVNKLEEKITEVRKIIGL